MQKIFFKLGLIVSVLGMVSCSGHSAWWNNGEYEYPAPGEEFVFEEQETKTEVVSEPVEVPASEPVDYWNDDPIENAKIYNKRIPPLNTLIVCRDKQCAPAELSQGKEYIYNALAHLIDNNLDTTALLCEANPQAHVCVNPYITVPAKVGVTPAYVFFDGVKFIDGSVVKGRTAIDLTLGYNLSYNGQTPTVCKPDTAMLYVKNNNEIVLNGKGFKCDMTSVGTTTIRVMFAVDYVDLDYGYIGGYYSIGLSGPAYGGGSGYGIIRLTKDGHPLRPSLKAPKNAPQRNTMAQSSVRPVSNPAAKPNVQPSVAPVPAKAPEVNPSEPVVQNPEKISIDSQNANEHTLQAQPVQVMPNHEHVKSASAPVATEQKPVDPQIPVANEPAYEEIYVDDLDEYIK